MTQADHAAKRLSRLEAETRVDSVSDSRTSAKQGVLPYLHAAGEGKIYYGDNLEVMPEKLADDSVSLIMTSPPYADARKKTYGGIPPEKYVEWFLPRAEEMKRILHSDGSMVINIKEGARNGEKMTYVWELIMALRQETGFRWVEEYIWHKTTAAPGKWPNRFRDQWERLLHFTKQKSFKMNQRAVMVPVGDWVEQRLANLSENDTERQESATGSGIGRKMSAWKGRKYVYPGNVLHGPPVCNNTGHSAAYPEWLPEFFIKLFTDEGDTVLDPFSGSGTTVRVAQRLGRVGIGIELHRPTNESDVRNVPIVD